MSKKLSKTIEHQDNSSYVHTRCTHTCPQSIEHVCFFCQNPGTSSSSLYNASTYKIDAKVREYTIALEDTAVLAKLSGGNMIAIEAKFH